MEVEAGVTTARVRNLARENGLLFPPDPEDCESNLALNAHAGKNEGGSRGRHMRSTTAFKGSALSLGHRQEEMMVFERRKARLLLFSAVL